MKLTFLTAFAAVSLAPYAAFGQKTQNQPVVDSAAQASPTDPKAVSPVTDTSQQASPVDAFGRNSSASLPANTTLRVTLNEGIDSGNLKNGQMVHARLGKTLAIAPAGQTTKAWKEGTPVLLEVVATVPAGKLNAVGEISLQLVKVGNQDVYTNILTFRGEPGHRDLPDSNPLIGTNAGLTAGAAVTFTVQRSPTFAGNAPLDSGNVPGSITEHASGSKPPNFGQPTNSAPSGSAVNTNSTTEKVSVPKNTQAPSDSTTGPR